MKKLTLILLLLACMLTIHAQSPFTTYTPASPGTSAPRQQSQDEQLQTITAYFVNQRGAFEKIRLKVRVISSQYGGSQVYVRAYYNSTYDVWNSMNSRATQITAYSNDPAVIKENFDWKCYILNIGNVYF